jgi:long-subunit acyl-CoA synthetase (AMP-forming)
MYYFKEKKLLQAFGMTETTGGHTLNNEKDFRLEATGKERDGVHSKIINADEDQQGEVSYCAIRMACVVTEV